jgi:hypothetical protein
MEKFASCLSAGLLPGNWRLSRHLPVLPRHRFANRGMPSFQLQENIHHVDNGATV